MSLLDHPTESFKQIVHDLVSSAGVAETWPLRSVCRTFAVEIKSDVLSRRTREVFCNRSDKNVLRHCLATYLLNRLEQPFGANPNFLAKGTAIVDWLAQTLTLPPQTCAEKLCRGLLDVLILDEIIDAFWCESHIHSVLCGSMCRLWVRAGSALISSLATNSWLPLPPKNMY